MSKKDVIEIEIVNKNVADATIDDIERNGGRTLTAAQKKAKKVFDERKEARRLVSVANKRLRRLEKNGMTDNPAYKALNGEYFSVKGKNQSQIQSLIRDANKFLKAATSTVRGTNKYLKDMAKNTGVVYKDLTELKKMTPKFFELASKTEQYLRNVEDMASAIDYNQIWQQVNIYVKENEIDLTKAQGDIDEMIKHVANALKKYEETETVSGTTFRLKK